MKPYTKMLLGGLPTVRVPARYPAPQDLLPIPPLDCSTCTRAERVARMVAALDAISANAPPGVRGVRVTKEEYDAVNDCGEDAK